MLGPRNLGPAQGCLGLGLWAQGVGFRGECLVRNTQVIARSYPTVPCNYGHLGA